MAPEGHVHLEPAPVHGYLQATRHRVFFADAVKYYVDHTLKMEKIKIYVIKFTAYSFSSTATYYEDLPQTVNAEKVSHDVEEASLQGA